MLFMSDLFKIISKAFAIWCPAQLTTLPEADHQRACKWCATVLQGALSHGNGGHLCPRTQAQSSITHSFLSASLPNPLKSSHTNTHAQPDRHNAILVAYLAASTSLLNLQGEKTKCRARLQGVPTPAVIYVKTQASQPGSSTTEVATPSVTLLSSFVSHLWGFQCDFSYGLHSLQALCAQLHKKNTKT